MTKLQQAEREVTEKREQMRLIEAFAHNYWVRRAFLYAAQGGAHLRPDCAPKWNIGSIRKGDHPTIEVQHEN